MNFADRLFKKAISKLNMMENTFSVRDGTFILRLFFEDAQTISRELVNKFLLYLGFDEELLNSVKMTAQGNNAWEVACYNDGSFNYKFNFLKNNSAQPSPVIRKLSEVAPENFIWINGQGKRKELFIAVYSVDLEQREMLGNELGLRSAFNFFNRIEDIWLGLSSRLDGGLLVPLRLKSTVLTQEGLTVEYVER